ncbi:phage exclusion lipoprotein Cor [Citrobacter sp. FR21M1BA2611]|uniref:phage exclusion lipoprotein Cor n=1 Tax=Citrobacter sp. FR21M1BA2611 TaxID=3381295 RepID=UPI003A988141|nr:super-infection exclusion protein [Escherichia phage vB-Eco-KMB25]
MKKSIIAAIAASILITGCSNMPKRECSATYENSGMNYEVAIFGVKRVGDRTLVKPGYPFSYQWVSVDNFKNSDCSI